MGSNPTGGMDVYLLSGRDLCDELITRPYRLWRVVVCYHENFVDEEAIVRAGLQSQRIKFHEIKSSYVDRNV
jgi:hypothetical protein